jgi:hypothetical protein
MIPSSFLTPSNQPAQSSSISGFFTTLASTISDLFGSTKNAIDRRDLERVGTWLEQQNPKVSLITPLPASEREVHPLESFLQGFISTSAVKLFETSVIDEIKSLISKGITSATQYQSDKVMEFLTIENQKNVLDLTKPEVVAYVDQGIHFLLQYSTQEEVKQEMIKYCEEKNYRLLVINKIRASEQGFSVHECQNTLGLNDYDIRDIIQRLRGKLIPRMLKSDKFGKALGGAIFVALKPIVDRVLGKELPQISPTVKLVSDIASHLLGQRITTFYQSIDVPQVLDKIIIALNGHVEAYIDDAKHVKPFKNSLELKTFFEGFSDTILDFILNKKQLELFLTHLKDIRSELLKGVEDPFVRGVVDILIQEENQLTLTQAILATKPFVSPILSKSLIKLGLTVFPKERIYKLLFDTIAPPLYDLMRKLIVRKLIPYELIDNQKFIEIFSEFCSSDEEPSKDLVNYLEKTTIGRETEIIKQIVPALKELRAMLKKRGGGDDYKERLKTFNAEPFRNEGPTEYAELVMNVVFGMGGGITKHLNDWDFLKKLFNNIFLDGIGDLRGWEVNAQNKIQKIENFDGHKVLFDLIKPALDPYRDPKEIENLFTGSSNSWTDEDIQKRIKKEAEILSDLLIKVVIVAGGKGSTSKFIAEAIRQAGLQAQLETVLNKLFSHSEVNYNIYTVLLKILQAEIKQQNDSLE